MAKYSFSARERFAVYTVHGDKCYLCNVPIDLKTMQVDHILPESLLSDPNKLQKIMDLFGLAESFDMNGFENWLPACPHCNRKKTDTVFEPTPIIQVCLQKAQKYAEKTRDICQTTRSKQLVARALNILEQAADADTLSGEEIEWIADHYKRSKRDAEIYKLKNPIPDHIEHRKKNALSLQLTPMYSIVFEGDTFRMVKGPYGVGYQPKHERPHSSFYCGQCGSLGPWNGARCTTCGFLDDGD